MIGNDERMHSLQTIILDILETNRPENIKELVKLVQEQIDSTTEDITKEIKLMEKNGIVLLEEPTKAESFFSYLYPKKNCWFWVVVGTSFISFASILFLPETGTPLSYIRYLLAFLLVAFLPGYCLTEVLFPKKTALDTIERIAFSIGLSFSIIALLGLFLSFTNIGLTLTTSLPSLGSVVIILAMVALVRKYRLRMQ